MSIQKLTQPAAGDAWLPLYSSVVKTKYQTANISSGEFVATPPTPINEGLNAGFLFNGSSGAVINARFYWHLIGGITGSMVVSIRSANNLIVYASAALNLVTPVYPTPLNLLAAFPAIDNVPLKVVIETDAACNSTIIPLAVDIFNL